MPIGEGVWGDTAVALADGAVYRNVFTGERVASQPDGTTRVADVLASFPVALLERIDLETRVTD